MQLADGYKQTEVGVVPDDWCEKRIGDVAAIQVGRDVREDSFSAFRGSAHPFPVYSNTVEDRGLYGFYSFAEYEGKSVTVVGRGVGLGTAFARTGGFGAIGRLVVLFPNGEVDSDFLAEYINHNVSIFHESSGVPQLTGIKIAGYRIAVPPLEEQRAIAEALSDVDALINALDALITKKRHIKQGTMQQLLAGKQRLPGFSGEWDGCELSDLGSFRAGDGFPTRFQDEQNGDYPFFKVGDLSRNGNEFEMTNAVHFISESVKNAINAKPFDAGAIVFAKIGAAVHLERKRMLVRPSCIDNNLMAFIVDKERMIPQFAYYRFQEISLGNYANTSAVPSLNSSDLKKIGTQLPSIQEQSAIAEVLSDMDAEITALEQKRDKTKLIKQGMMQELLTGKTRLVARDQP